MASDGILEVFLVDARGLRDRDFIGKMDPYVVIQYGNQERMSKVLREQGRNPVWNERLTFKMDHPTHVHNQHKVTLRIMDKDSFTKDDFVGEAVIYVKDVVSLGLENGTAQLPPSTYRVVLVDKKYYGGIKVGVKFTRKVEDGKVLDVGGWKQSLHVI